MKKILSIVLVLALLFGVNIYAQSISPGSTQDPLVSKSYIDQQISHIMSIINDIDQRTKTVSVPEPVASTQSFEPVMLKAGDILLGGEGAEIILRSGQGVGYTAVQNGLVDVTGGVDIYNETPVLLNHLIIVPRSDGRGVRALEESWFIVKGGYNIISGN